MIKYLLDINIPYWFNKQLNILLWTNNKKKIKILTLTFWLNYRVKELEGYEKDWFLGNRKNFVLWKWDIK